MANPPREVKECEQCHRPFENRKRWSGREQWEQVKYCSKRCRADAAKERRSA